MFRRPTPPGGFKPTAPRPIPATTPLLISDVQMRRLHACAKDVGVSHDTLRSLSSVIQSDLTSLKQLSVDGFRHLMTALERSYGARIESHERAPGVVTSTPAPTARTTPVVSGLVAMKNGGDVVAAVKNHGKPAAYKRPTPCSDKFANAFAKYKGKPPTSALPTDDDVNVEWAGIQTWVATTTDLFLGRRWDGKVEANRNGRDVFRRNADGSVTELGGSGYWDLRNMQIPW